MVYIKLKEMSQYELASNTNPFDILTHWDLGFTIIIMFVKWESMLQLLQDL